MNRYIFWLYEMYLNLMIQSNTPIKDILDKVNILTGVLWHLCLYTQGKDLDKHAHFEQLYSVYTTLGIALASFSYREKNA